jgi:hypothetical protein
MAMFFIKEKLPLLNDSIRKIIKFVKNLISIKKRVAQILTLISEELYLINFYFHHL